MPFVDMQRRKRKRGGEGSQMESSQFASSPSEPLHQSVLGPELLRDRGESTRALAPLPDHFASLAEYERFFRPLLLEEAREELRRSFALNVSSNAYTSCSLASLSLSNPRWCSLRVASNPSSSIALSSLLDSNPSASCPLIVFLFPGTPHDDSLDLSRSRWHSLPALPFACICDRDRFHQQANEADLWFRRDALDSHTLSLLSRSASFVHSGDGPTNSHKSIPYSNELSTTHDNQSEISWHMVCSTKLVTQEAELEALSNVSTLRRPLKRTVLKPSQHPGPRFASADAPELAPELHGGFDSYLGSNFNPLQRRAIVWAAAQASGTGYWPFTLIQGPPGTGKTHTIWGMLNAMHVVHFQRFYEGHFKYMTDASTASNELPTDDSAACRNRKPKVLVCALSNAGVDVVLDRVAERGFVQNDGGQYFPPICRVGSGQETTKHAKRLQAGQLADQVIGMKAETIETSLQTCRGRRAEIEHYIAWNRSQMQLLHQQGSVNGCPEHMIDLQKRIGEASEDLRKMDVELYRLDLAQQVQRSQINSEKARLLLEASFVDEAEIVFTTLASSCKKVFQRINNSFDEVVLDEAAQASELSTLIPLQHSTKSMTMVGDTSQLPATVLSQDAQNALLGRSLFERLSSNGAEPLMLTIQYRMSTEVRKFPSKCFYNDMLSDSDSVLAREPERFHSIWPLHSYMVFDVQKGLEKRSKQRSLRNMEEAKLAALLVSRAMKDIAKTHSIAIITPYREQRDCIWKCLQNQLGSDNAAEIKRVRIETVDSFQGQEAELVVFSAVRASPEGGIGFLADTRRMNVALTRARCTLWVLGSASSLKQVEAWEQLFDDAAERGSLVSNASIETCLKNQATKALTKL